MVYAILAAGEGSRLAQEGCEVPKPLVRIQGETLIGRLIRVFVANGATRIVVIVNAQHVVTQEYVRSLLLPIPLDVVVQSTPSSMHSLYAIRDFLAAEERFCITTVDTIFSEHEFASYINAFRTGGLDGLMAVTSYVDDEKPLYVQTTPNLTITNFCDTCEERCAHVSGGIYCLTRKSLDTLSRCIQEGRARMRNFQRQLVADGLHLQAYPFSTIIDVDHCSDIPKAEQLISEWQR
ncbi:MAG: NTP transferase domain-containing protein [Bacteroidaceae bacterium]|nr:NTP transferase domain-containing protein [Bacteroidaceae bacterium]